MAMTMTPNHHGGGGSGGGGMGRRNPYREETRDGKTIKSPVTKSQIAVMAYPSNGSMISGSRVFLILIGWIYMLVCVHYEDISNSNDSNMNVNMNDNINNNNINDNKINNHTNDKTSGLRRHLNYTPQLRANTFSERYRSPSGQLVTAPLNPLGRVIDGTEVFYMLPIVPATTRAILIFFHDCEHSGQDLFLLPEHRIVALAALNEGIAVLSPTASDRSSGCWSTQDAETLNKPSFMEQWMQVANLQPTDETNNNDIPRIAMGVANGAEFIPMVYKNLNIKSAAVYYSSQVAGLDTFSPQHQQQEQVVVVVQDTTTTTKGGNTILPTVFVTMSRDEATTTSVRDAFVQLERLGVPTSMFDIEPHAFTPELCSKRIPELGDRRCRRLINAIITRGGSNLLDKNEFKVLTTPGTIVSTTTTSTTTTDKTRDNENHNTNETSSSAATGRRSTTTSSSSWDDVLQHSKLDDDLRHFVGLASNFEKGAVTPMNFDGHSWLWAGVEEVVSASYAQHGMSSEHRIEILDFLLQHATTAATT
eukprot:CAMPEP_0118692210 /NCGR_PEP_ID=MMETSP0800-20121206/11138_1 /TAXON_ID=210618 ORGANISM="Striatella unipunctata, Strain CCMP2910" /NCGR_SAMPLE_ID=MMETSP0800 /ASSEMBLY_ACC=CAM_ASM_000638 /LENGTH=533 /DNA_ID=CAMNT_0006590133 /DNA_START=9 /DNA_END=1607 /DNA_ORIENTATION=+